MKLSVSASRESVASSAVRHRWTWQRMCVLGTGLVREAGSEAPPPLEAGSEAPPPLAPPSLAPPPLVPTGREAAPPPRAGAGSAVGLLPALRATWLLAR